MRDCGRRLRFARKCQYAGKTLAHVYVMQGSLTAAGPWDIYFDDISLNSADGTVRPIYNGQTSLSLDMSGTSGVSGRSYEINHLSGIAAMPDETTSYYHTDQISSARLMTSVNGYAIWAATYLPFGYEYNAQPGVNRYKFATYQRDAESGLDYAKFRYYSSSIGRFMSPDPAGMAAVDITNPQSWNRYGYVGNDPLDASDPLGLFRPVLPSGFLDWMSLNCGGLFCDFTSLNPGDIGNAGSAGGGRKASPKPNPANNSPTKKCSGTARGLQGNTDLYGRQGSFGTVRPNTAAIIPRQFGYPTDVAGRSAMMPYVSQISGTLTTTRNGRIITSTFTSVTDVIGGKSPIPGVPVRDALMQLFPGRFIVEVPGGVDVGASATVTLTIPSALKCPEGTTEQP